MRPTLRRRWAQGGASVLVIAASCARAVQPSRPIGEDALDIVLVGGRVMDPESGVDERLNVGVGAGRIRALSKEPMVGRETVDVRGMVVAPGFVDLHAHAQDEFGARLHVQDGVTTHLEAEVGVYPVARWYAERTGRALINFGATVGHKPARVALMHPGYDERKDPPIGDDADFARRAATAEELERLAGMLDGGLREGGLGIGFHLAYTPGATPAELERMVRVAAARRAPSFLHIRKHGTEFVKEAIEITARAGAALHLVHITSSCPNDVREALQVIAAARARGVDVTTEVYPYTAGQPYLTSPIFDEGWRERRGLDYRDVQLVSTGERLTKDTFEAYRKAYRGKAGGYVFLHYIPQAAADLAVAAPGVMIASDSMPFEGGRGHPRGAGTFARVLGRHVREKKALGLMEALAKMTILPARRLETVAPRLRNKGRLRVGADADVTVFDPAAVIDRATYENGGAAPSAGIPYVLVNGVFVVRQGALVPGVFPGHPVRAE